VDLKYATNCVGGRGSAPDPAVGAHDAPPDPLVGWGGGYSLPISHPTRLLDLCAQCKILATRLSIGTDKVDLE